MLPGIPTALIAPCSTSFHPMFHVLRHFSTLTVEPQTAHRLLAEPLHCPYASPVTGTVLLAIPRSIRDVPFSPLQNALLYFQHPKKNVAPCIIQPCDTLFLSVPPALSLVEMQSSNTHINNSQKQTNSRCSKSQKKKPPALSTPFPGAHVPKIQPPLHSVWAFLL